MATTLLPFRQVHENDVVNLYALDAGAGTRGLIVQLDSTAGWQIGDDLGTSAVSSTTYSNTVTDRYNVKARVKAAASGRANAVPFGMLMYDVAETDENGEKLIYHPRKAHEMQVSVSGQAVPVLTKGIVLVKVESADLGGVTPAAGTNVFAGAAGAMVCHSAPETDMCRIGTCLGKTGVNGELLVKLDFNGEYDRKWS